MNSSSFEVVVLLTPSARLLSGVDLFPRTLRLRGPLLAQPLSSRKFSFSPFEFGKDFCVLALSCFCDSLHLLGACHVLLPARACPQFCGGRCSLSSVLYMFNQCLDIALSFFCAVWLRMLFSGHAVPVLSFFVPFLALHVVFWTCSPSSFGFAAGPPAGLCTPAFGI